MSNEALHQTSIHAPGAEEGGGPSCPPSGARNVRAVRVVGPLLVAEIILWTVLFGVAGLFRDGPNGKSLGTDFAVFSGAASALKHGANPYDYRTLYHFERALLTRQHLPVTTQVFNVRAGNPPLFYWLLQPLTDMPFQAVALAWIALMYATSAVGFLLALRYFGWRRRFVPALVFMLLPQVVTGAAYGNVHGPVFAALALCLLLAARHPAIAGIVASCGWLKPQLAFPLVLLIFLFHAPARGRFASGWAGATAALLGLTVLTSGWNSLALWLNGLNSWSRGIDREPNIASLSGLYVTWTSRPVQLALALALLLFALALTARVWSANKNAGSVRMLAVGWLWGVWFLVAPFAHFPDEILLTVPILALLGRDGDNLRAPLAAASLYLAFLSLALIPTPFVSLSVVGLTVILARASTSTFGGGNPAAERGGATGRPA